MVGTGPLAWNPNNITGTELGIKQECTLLGPLYSYYILAVPCEGLPWPLAVLLVTDRMGMQQTLETVSTPLLPDRCTAIEGLGWILP